ncbi:phage tail tape measure protein [Salmonella enterica subsp. enterica]|nr:phage tail tape measure protein [Salmonella enterica subsp. enterica]
MQKESDINKDSLSAQWLLVKTGAQNAFSSLGETLRQPLMDIMGMVKRVTGALRRWVEQNPVLAGTLMKVAAATAAITVGLGRWQWRWLLCWDRWRGYPVWPVHAVS